MRRIRTLVAVLSTASLALGCPGSGGTINFDPATNSDVTKPAVNLLVTRPGAPDVEVQALSGPSANKITNYGNPKPKAKSDFSVLATATDNESGIRNIKLTMTRQVCFTATGGPPGGANGAFATVVRKEASYTDPTHAPKQASLGETGIIDNSNFGTDPANLTEVNLLVFRTAQGTLRVADGVSTKWNMQATNFAGQTTISDVIFVAAGNTTCITNP